LEAFLDLGLPELLGCHTGEPLTAAQIIPQLGLHPIRGWKFLHICSMSELLIEIGGERGDDTAQYTLSPLAVRFFGNRGDPSDSYYFRDLVAYWRYLDSLPHTLAQVIKGAELPIMPVWPPVTSENAQHLETWMTVTAQGAIDTLVASRVMDNAAHILDVGGGDGTIAIALVKDALARGLPLPHVTVFNLQNSAELALANIAREGMDKHISVHIGDFLTDDLPGGFDRVMYSRVLTDWTPNVCQMLLNKARNSLAPGGKIVINEAFNEGNWDYAISWEMRYVYYDTFGRYLFKPAETYEKIFTEIGCQVTAFHPMLNSAFYSVLVAEPKKDHSET
jgi:predicted O-methyltransferase YrrM